MSKRTYDYALIFRGLEGGERNLSLLVNGYLPLIGFLLATYLHLTCIPFLMRIVNQMTVMDG
jgi:hypothetical protein